jgi:hypothetical protein
LIKLIQEKLASYHAVNQLEEEYAIKEILQDIALYGLWRAGFFDLAAFQGGTSLRILYVKQGVGPNLAHLQSALFQWGPWAGRETLIDGEWLKKTLTEKIVQIDWREAAVDIERFLRPQEQHSLKLWNAGFFLQKIEQLLK